MCTWYGTRALPRNTWKVFRDLNSFIKNLYLIEEFAFPKCPSRAVSDFLIGEPTVRPGEVEVSRMLEDIDPDMTETSVYG